MKVQKVICMYCLLFIGQGNLVQLSQYSASARSALCGTINMDHRTSICCNGLVYIRSGSQPACCGNVGYDARHYLCCGTTIERKDIYKVPRCCGSNGYDAMRDRCNVDGYLERKTNLGSHCCMTETGWKCCSKGGNCCSYAGSGQVEIPGFRPACCELFSYSEKAECCANTKETTGVLPTCCQAENLEPKCCNRRDGSLECCPPGGYCCRDSVDRPYYPTRPEPIRPRPVVTTPSYTYPPRVATRAPSRLPQCCTSSRSRPSCCYTLYFRPNCCQSTGGSQSRGSSVSRQPFSRCCSSTRRTCCSVRPVARVVMQPCCYSRNKPTCCYSSEAYEAGCCRSDEQQYGSQSGSFTRSRQGSYNGQAQGNRQDSRFQGSHSNRWGMSRERYNGNQYPSYSQDRNNVDNHNQALETHYQRGNTYNRVSGNRGGSSYRNDQYYNRYPHRYPHTTQYSIQESRTQNPNSRSQVGSNSNVYQGRQDNLDKDRIYYETLDDCCYSASRNICCRNAYIAKGRLAACCPGRVDEIGKMGPRPSYTTISDFNFRQRERIPSVLSTSQAPYGGRRKIKLATTAPPPRYVPEYENAPFGTGNKDGSAIHPVEMPIWGSNRNNRSFSAKERQDMVNSIIVDTKEYNLTNGIDLSDQNKVDSYFGGNRYYYDNIHGENEDSVLPLENEIDQSKDNLFSTTPSFDKTKDPAIDDIATSLTPSIPTEGGGIEDENSFPYVPRKDLDGNEINTFDENGVILEPVPGESDYDFNPDQYGSISYYDSDGDGFMECNGEPYMLSVHICCEGVLRYRYGVKPSCCGTEAYDGFIFKCCDGEIRRSCDPEYKPMKTAWGSVI